MNTVQYGKIYIMKIVVICKGNVGRSQIAEALFRKYYPEMQVVSAGTAISGPEQPIGELMPHIQEVLDVMNEEKIDVSSYVRKQLTENMVRRADAVIAIIEDTSLLPLYVANSKKLVHWNVADPKGQDLETTREIKNQIKALVKNFN
jgi:protein-tyrosine-phosphatase